MIYSKQNIVTALQNGELEIDPLPKDGILTPRRSTCGWATGLPPSRERAQDLACM